MKKANLGRRVLVWFGILVCGTLLGNRYWEIGFQARADENKDKPAKAKSSTDKVVKTEEEWRKILTPQQFHVLREKGTERPFTGEYADHHEKGIYACAGCGQKLFASTTKFESGTGWPSFWQPLSKEA